MQTPARKRAEALFAEFTTRADRAPETARPAPEQVKAHASGPRTLHLPAASEKQPTQEKS